jgi:hypothetical protein
LRRMVDCLRERWPELQIEVRADAGFAVPAVYYDYYCESEGITYTIALITNPKLKEMAEGGCSRKPKGATNGRAARRGSLMRGCLRGGKLGEGTQGRLQGRGDGEGNEQAFRRYHQRNDEPKDLYEFYARRGEGENWIKDFKLHVKADRLSCHRFIANQFRLLLHACAYWLMDALRRKLIENGSRRMQLLDTLRLRLIKIGGRRVRELITKVRLHLASGHPGEGLWHALSLAFGGVHE